MVQLGEARASEQQSVSCLSFSSNGMLLLAGQANGDVVIWEWHRTVWQNVKHLKGVP